MKKFLYLATLSVILLVLLVPTAGAQRAPTEWSVSIEDFYFEPPDVAIAPGDKITWTNEGNAPHTVTADDGSFDSGTLQPGQSFSWTFEAPGTLAYHCTIHPDMLGSVSVGGEAGEEAAAAVPTEPPVVPATPEYSGSSPGMTSMNSGY